MTMERLANRLSSFWSSCLWAAAFGVLLIAAGRLLRVSIDPAVAVILALFFWIVLLLAARGVLRHGSAVLMRSLDPGAEPGETQPADLRRALHDKNRHFPWTWTGRDDDGAGDDELAADPAPLVDEVEIEISSWYLPIQALVWSLPAAGFVGTAWHLRSLVVDRADPLAPVSEAAASASIGAAIVVVCSALVCSAVAYVATALSQRAELYALQRIKAVLSRHGPRAEKGLGDEPVRT